MAEVICGLCGKPIPLETPDRDIASQVEGWEIKRSGGGLHALSQRRETGRYAHSACVRAGIRPSPPPQSERLFP